jgi:type I restriction enzyme R subunit
MQNGKPRRCKGRANYLLRLIVSQDTQSVAVALIEAKAEDKSPAAGLCRDSGTVNVTG